MRILIYILLFVSCNVYSQNIIVFNIDTVKVPTPNSGASGTTDWVNPVSGLAEGYTKSSGSLTTSIVTGNGFTGNAQQSSSTPINTSSVYFRATDGVALNGEFEIDEVQLIEIKPEYAYNDYIIEYNNTLIQQ